MPEFDYQGAKEAGWDDEEITNFITSENKKGAGLFVKSLPELPAEKTPEEFSFAGEFAKPFAKLGTTVGSLGLAATGQQEKLEKIKQEGITIPGVGKGIKPFETKGEALLGGAEAGLLATPGRVGKATEILAKQGIKATGGAIKSISALASSLPKDVIARAANPIYAKRIEQSIKHVVENPKQPFLTVAKQVGDRITSLSNNVKKNLESAQIEFKRSFPNARFNVQTRFTDIVSALDKFRNVGIKVEQVGRKGVTGIIPQERVTNFVITKTPQSPLSQSEISKLNNLLGKIQKSSAVDVDDLIALKKSFFSAYNQVPLGVNNKPTTYHAIVMSLKKNADDVVDSLLPEKLKKANAAFRKIEDLKLKFGNKIVDEKGNIKTGSEQFLSNIGNLNKGVLRKITQDVEGQLGLNIQEEIQLIKDAQKLSQPFVVTGSRERDIVVGLAKSTLASAIGGFVGGPIGAITALGLTSPKAVGQAATGLGKARGQLQKIPESIRKALQNINFKKSSP